MTEEERLLRQYNPTLRERVEGGIYDIGGLLGADPRSTLMRNIAGSAGGLLDFIPGVGDYVGGEEAYRDYKSGDYYNAGIGAAATAAGLVPGIGDAAGKLIRQLGKVKKEELDPLKYSNTKLDKYINEVEVGVRPTNENLPRLSATLEDHYGDYLMPWYWDKSARGGLLESVDGARLNNPIYLEGGTDFMVGPAAQADRAVKASGKTIVNRVVDKANMVKEKTGRDVIGVTGTMGSGAVDFATFGPASVIAELIPGSKILKKDMKAFDEDMLKIDPDWPGVESKNLTDYLYKTGGENRKAFTALVGNSKYQKAGFPNEGKARYAVTDESLRDVPSGLFGLGMAKIDTGVPSLLDPTVPHSTYDTQMTGTYLGGLQELVPQRILFRDAYNAFEGQLDKKGNPITEQNITYALGKQFPTQIIDEELINSVNKYFSEGR